MRNLRQLLGALWFIGVLAFLAYDYIFHAPKAKRTMEALEVEALSIVPPSAATESHRSATHKTSQALVESTYTTTMSYRELRTYYDAELAAHGWTLVREKSLHDWGRDLGGAATQYRKGEYSASLQFAGSKANYGWTYALGFSWGLSS